MSGYVEAVKDMMQMLRDRNATYERLTAENAALRKRVEELEGALKPFVPAHQYWMDEYPDGARCGLYNRVTWGDVRRARNALSANCHGADSPQNGADSAALRAKGGEHGE